MRPWLRYMIGLVAGLALGGGAAVQSIRSSGMGDEIRNGPWSTGRDVGSADADIRTRAVVALRGLLALPKNEARYFNATADSAGRPLRGTCTYLVTGGRLDAEWWSVTVYDPQGWLIVNRWNRHSVGSAAIPDAFDDAWEVQVGPAEPQGPQPAQRVWVPSGTNGAFDLTLRTYRPTGALRDQPDRATLPVITRQGCAA